jgi:hypothetical protein
MANPLGIGGPQPGEVRNPLGRPKSIFQDYGPRAEHFLKKLTRSQILALGDNPDRLDADYSSFDAGVIMHLANWLRGDRFAPEERERLLDRTVGKPKQALTGGDEGDKPLIPDKIEIVLKKAPTSGD